MFEDALFGHVRGAFTGANSDSPGYLAEAHGGTVLLDERTHCVQRAFGFRISQRG